MYPQIEQRVSRPGVEAADDASRRQVGDVGEAADVDHHTMLPGATEGCRVKSRHERRSLAACGQVAIPEIGDDVDAREFGQQSRIDNLNREAGFRTMPDGLPVAPDRPNRVRPYPGCGEQRRRRIRILARYFARTGTGDLEFIVAGRAQCQQAFAKAIRKRLVVRADQAEPAVVRPFAEGSVHTIDTGTRHQACIKPRSPCRHDRRRVGGPASNQWHYSSTARRVFRSR